MVFLLLLLCCFAKKFMLFFKKCQTVYVIIDLSGSGSYGAAFFSEIYFHFSPVDKLQKWPPASKMHILATFLLKRWKTIDRLTVVESLPL